MNDLKVERPKIDFSEMPAGLQAPSCAERLEEWLGKEIKEKLKCGWTEAQIRECIERQLSPTLFPDNIDK